jgi:hypothetical protein
MIFSFADACLLNQKDGNTTACPATRCVNLKWYLDCDMNATSIQKISQIKNRYSALVLVPQVFNTVRFWNPSHSHH